MNNKYDLDKYNQIIKKCGFDDIEKFEFWVLIKRFLSNKQIYKLALNYKDINDEIKQIVKKYKDSYEKSVREDSYFSLDHDDADILIKHLVINIDFETLRDFLKENPPKLYGDVIGCFRGYVYSYIVDGELKKECDWDNVYKDTMKALKDTKGRVFYPLKALLCIYEERGCYTISFDISTVYQEMVAHNGYAKRIPPKDLTILRAYRIYHGGCQGLPIECIPVIDKALEDYRKKNKIEWNDSKPEEFREKAKIRYNVLLKCMCKSNSYIDFLFWLSVRTKIDESKLKEIIGIDESEIKNLSFRNFHNFINKWYFGKK